MEPIRSTFQSADFPDLLVGLERAVVPLIGDELGLSVAEVGALVAVGTFADLVLFDPTRLAVGRTRLARDFPADSSRLVVDAEGSQHVARFHARRCARRGRACR